MKAEDIEKRLANAFIAAVLMLAGTVAVLAGPVAAASAQEPSPAPEEVRVEVVVHRDGEPIPTPDAAGLRLFVDDRQTAFDWIPEEPIALAVIMDLSSSMTGEKLRAAVRGISGLFSSLGEDDRCALLSFTRRIELHSGWEGTCADAAEAAGALRSGGPAALNNALTLALGLLAAAPGRPVLALFTDGVDGASWTRDTWPLVAAAGQAPLVFAVTAPAAQGAGRVGGLYGSVSADDLANQITFEGRHLQDSGRDLRGLRNTDPFWALAELAQLSGGALVRTEGSPEEIEAELASLGAAVRARTSLRFRPPAGLAPGWYSLRVESSAGEVQHRIGFAWPE